MKAREVASETGEAQEGDDLFEMADLFPHRTGAPTTVWISRRGNARHDVRVKVKLMHGNPMNAANTAVVGGRPVPRPIAWRLLQENGPSRGPGDSGFRWRVGIFYRKSRVSGRGAENLSEIFTFCVVQS